MAQPNAAQLITNSMKRSIVTKANAAFLGNVADPTGLLTTVGITDGAVAANLDALADVVAGIEAEGGAADFIVAAPDAWGSLVKLKTAAASAESLLGAGTQAAERRLLGIPVLTTSAMPEGTLLVLDKSSVLTVYGRSWWTGRSTRSSPPTPSRCGCSSAADGP